MPIKVFSDGSVLTAADVNDYLMEQSVITCLSSARPASPTQGMVIYETDVNRIRVWDGSAWLCIWAKGATYTPALTGMSIGSGGSAANSATWSFSGGELIITGEIVFGSSGATFPAATILANLPSGFTASPNPSTALPVGQCHFNDVGANGAYGVTRLNSTTSVRFVPVDAAGTYATLVATSALIPFTWVAGDGIYWNATIQGTF